MQTNIYTILHEMVIRKNCKWQWSCLETKFPHVYISLIRNQEVENWRPRGCYQQKPHMRQISVKCHSLKCQRLSTGSNDDYFYGFVGDFIKWEAYTSPAWHTGTHTYTEGNTTPQGKTSEYLNPASLGRWFLAPTNHCIAFWY